jgi:hypothetical protein
MPRNPHKQPCQHPDCKAWAVRGSDPPLCASHAGRKVGAPPGNQNRRTHGFYSRFLEPDEAVDLIAFSDDASLDDEIAITRVALNRVFQMLVSGTTPGPDPQPLAPGDYTRLVTLIFQGSGTISRLIRIKHDLARLHPDVFSDTLSEAVNQALDELSTEWGREL